MQRGILLVVNPTAARGRLLPVVEHVQARLRAEGLACTTAYSRSAGQVTELARAAAPCFEAVVAAGGDATVREVASGLLRAGEPQVALGVLPLGTGNDFATQVGLANLEAAVAALLDGAVRPLDAIEVRWRDGLREVVEYALLFAGAGFAAEVLRVTSPQVKRWFGRRFSYSVGFFRALVGFRSPAMKVRADGRDFSGAMFHVCAGNSEWAGGGAMRLSPGARMDDGRLDLCLIESLSKLEVLRCFPKLVRTFTRHPKVRYFPGNGLDIVSDAPVPLALDGDVTGRTPARFRVLRGALRVLAPARPTFGST